MTTSPLLAYPLPVPPAAPALLEVRGLSVAFAGHAAVHDLDFSITRGETLALVGESGCGKSATALALMRLLPVEACMQAAHIRFDGQDLTRLSERDMRELRGKRISMIFQEPMSSLNPLLSIGDQISEVLRRHEAMSRRQARNRVVELLDLVRVPNAQERYDTYPHQLSGGMRQRVMIAMAVACGPELLIADEPTTALDVTIQAQVLELLDSLRRQLSMAVLLITHDLGVVAHWANRVAVMYAGRLVEQSDADTLFADPRHPYARGLLDATVKLDSGQHYLNSRLREIPGSIESARSARGCAFAPRCAHAIDTCLHAVPALVQLSASHYAACPVVTPNAQGGGHALAFG